VLVALDGSGVAEGVLPFAEKIAGPLDAEVVLLRVVEPVSPADAMASAGVAIPDTLFLRELHAKEYLTAMAKRLQAKGLRVRTALRVGVPAAEIVGAAADERADLIAMTTHGRSGFRRALFGSVAESVLRSAEVPVLMMRFVAREAPVEAGRR
jgi:nucleotide-binding universal stress UspA family protein